jgi:hypothetical protein
MESERGRRQQSCGAVLSLAGGHFWGLILTPSASEARIFKAQVAPQDRSWMWASGHSAATVKRAAHGYEPTREAAMAAFAKSWRRE